MKTLTVTSGLSASIVRLADSAFESPSRSVERDLALEVRLVDGVVVDDADRPDAGGCEVEPSRRAKPARADQEDARVEQLLLSFLADLGNEEMPAVAAPLRLVEGLRQLERKAVSLPVGEPACERGDVLVAELFKRAGSEGRRLPPAQYTTIG